MTPLATHGSSWRAFVTLTSVLHVGICITVVWSEALARGWGFILKIAFISRMYQIFSCLFEGLHVQLDVNRSQLALKIEQTPKFGSIAQASC